MFLILRNYYTKTSAIEIFTYDPYKSYYFNFKDEFESKKKSKSKNILNILFQYLDINSNFHLIKYKDNIRLYYNKYYRPMLFPFITDKKLDLDEMSNFYNNYDLLTIINILANRSFKDLYQYPVFPLLYNPSYIDLKNKRDMSQHVGLQPYKEAELKKNFIIKNYLNDDEDDEGYLKENGKKEKKYLLYTYFSNPAYVAGFLIRLFPYALLSINLQGKYFDDPNRLFFSVKNATQQTFKQKADNREYIPEFYYLPDLFINKNEFFFGKNTAGTEVNNCYINSPEENNYKKYEFLANIKNELEFDNLDINKWIDLFFGMNQKSYNYKKDKQIIKMDYYPENMDWNFYKGKNIQLKKQI